MSECWECARRQVQCDGGRPICTQCRAAHIVCPGYEDTKPLRWLAPGKVKSRTWSRKATIRTKKKDDTGSATSKATKKAGSLEDFPPPPGKALQLQKKHAAILEKKAKKAIAPADPRPREGDVMVPLLTTTPPYVQWRSQDYALAQAVAYFNDCVYPQLVDDSLCPSPYISQIHDLHYLNSNSKATLLCMAVGHRIFATQSSNALVVKDMWSQLFHHRGMAMRHINEDIAKESTRFTNRTIHDIIFFCCSELQHTSSSEWRYHLDGAMALISHRGGLTKMLTDIPAFSLMMRVFVIVKIIGETTSPAVDKATADWLQGDLKVVEGLFKVLHYPRCPCPVPLLLKIIHITRLRVMEKDVTPGNTTVADEANEILREVEEFEPEEYGKAFDGPLDCWTIIARLFQSAVALYCIGSLTCMGNSTKMRRRRTAHLAVLLADLEVAVDLGPTRAAVVWPLVIGGFEAKWANDEARTFVREKLVASSIRQGTIVPLMAKEALERFWRTSSTSWEDCFDRPYGFVV